MFPMTLPRRVAAWGTETALLLSGLAGARDDFSLLPVFADALEDAGCGCAVRLAHLRGDVARHGRGCWALAPSCGAARARHQCESRAKPRIRE